MSNSINSWIQNGDWVSGTSKEDERFIGFVESVDAYGTVKVLVTQCDRIEAVGEIVESSLGRLDKMSEEIQADEADLLSLMDLALMTRDKAWFEDLYSALRMVQFQAAPKSGAGKGPSFGSGGRRVTID
ncbi:hypothetical protein [Paenibacillus rigui]|uniref:Group-specific protein n=1 Tax=Paenibacillus rigui TaxID=554312 RepID=A0A229UJ43_9BACL|nr:hypothetical protein [Paenibacillus rigui]OXM83305.1 group-specific protein [Paenibacillus rigui]